MTGGPSRWLAVLDRVDTAPAHDDLPPSGRERFPLVPGVLFPSRTPDFAVTPSRDAIRHDHQDILRSHRRAAQPMRASSRSHVERQPAQFLPLLHHAKQNAWLADNCGMKCVACRKRTVPPHARLGTKYCSAACRGMAFRERHKSIQWTQHPEPPSTTENGGAEQTPSVTRERTPNERRRRTPTVTSSDEKLPSDAVPRPSRLAFVEQLRKQRPEGAAGYRLVLSARSPADTPKIVPLPDSQGGIRYWRLEPFEIPDDIRLQDGLSYRVLWVDAAGQPLAPTTPYVPRLYFFLGPPDAEMDERNAAYDAILRDVRDPAMRQSIEAEVARSRLALQREREREAIRQQQTQREEILYRIHTQQIEDDRLRRREDRIEQERRQDREKAERERQLAEQSAKNEREMWTGIKVMGGIAAAAAIGWGPFMTWLDSLTKRKKKGKHANKDRQVEDAGRALEPLLQKVETLLSAQKLGATQTQAEPHSNDGTSEQTAQFTVSTAANGPSADSRPAAVPTVPPAAERQPAETASAVTDAQHTPQAETAAAAQEQVASPSPQQSSSDPVASSAPSQTSSEPRALDESLSEAQIQTVCGIVLDPERMALVAYENECAKAHLLDTPPPPEPSLDLSSTERKEIRAVLSSPILLDALLTLSARFRAAAAGGGEAMFALPSPFQSLKPHDRERIQRTIATPEQRDYFLFQNQRRDARLSGLPMPLAGPTDVPDKEQKAIRRLFRDERVLHYLCTHGVLSSSGMK